MILASIFATLAMTAILVVFASQVQALPTPSTFIVQNTAFYLWKAPHAQVVVVLYGGAMLDSRCPYTYNVYTKTYGAASSSEQAWVSELYNYGFDVVAIKTGSTYSGFECYTAGMTWVRDLINTLHSTYGYSKVSLFGHSAGGVIVAYEIEQRTNINGAVFVSAPVNHYPDPLFQSAQNAKSIKTNVRLQWGHDDPVNLSPEMQVYLTNAQSSSHVVQYDFLNPGNMHDHYFDSGTQWQSYRNLAKSFLWYYS